MKLNKLKWEHSVVMDNPEINYVERKSFCFSSIMLSMICERKFYRDWEMLSPFLRFSLPFVVSLYSSNFSLSVFIDFLSAYAIVSLELFSGSVLHSVTKFSFWSTHIICNLFGTVKSPQSCLHNSRINRDDFSKSFMILTDYISNWWCFGNLSKMNPESFLMIPTF